MWTRFLPLAAGTMLWLGQWGQVHAQTEAGKPQQTITNSIGMPLVRIEAGEFWMGTLTPIDKVAEWFKDEGATTNDFTADYPRHKVKITKPFFMGRHEVTVGQFRRFVTETNYISDAERDGKGGIGWNQETNKLENGSQYIWQNPGWVPNDDTHPIVNVTWNDAQRFCKWLSQKEKTPYRLPTDAEWEYACRAGNQTLYWNGDAPENLAQIANVKGATATAKTSGVPMMVNSRDGYRFTAPVGMFLANPWGLQDMHGNVAELCADAFSDLTAYRRQNGGATVEDPFITSGDGSHIHRGGNFMDRSLHIRSAFRAKNNLGFRHAGVGFRVVSAAGP